MCVALAGRQVGGFARTCVCVCVPLAVRTRVHNGTQKNTCPSPTLCQKHVGHYARRRLAASLQCHPPRVLLARFGTTDASRCQLAVLSPLLTLAGVAWRARRAAGALGHGAALIDTRPASDQRYLPPRPRSAVELDDALLLPTVPPHPPHPPHPPLPAGRLLPTILPFRRVRPQ